MVDAQGGFSVGVEHRVHSWRVLQQAPHLVDAGGNELASDDEGGIASCSQLSPVNSPAVANMAAGTYHVWVKEFFDQGVISGYELHLEIQ